MLVMNHQTAVRNVPCFERKKKKSIDPDSHNPPAYPLFGHDRRRKSEIVAQQTLLLYLAPGTHSYRTTEEEELDT